MLHPASESRATQPRPGTPGARAAAMARATREGRAGRDDLAWMRAAARRMVLHARVR
jgi:hypothetical protein